MNEKKNTHNNNNNMHEFVGKIMQKLMPNDGQMYYVFSPQKNK